jgi:hypothetical protein
MGVDNDICAPHWCDKWMIIGMVIATQTGIGAAVGGRGANAVNGAMSRFPASVAKRRWRKRTRVLYAMALV